MTKMHRVNDRDRLSRSIRGQAVDNTMRGTRQELSAARRHIYDEIATGADWTPDPLPPRRSVARDCLAGHVRDLKAAGFTHLEVALALHIADSSVTALCREYAIASVYVARGGHRRAGA